MNLLEAWEKAEEGQKIFLCKKVITKRNCECMKMMEIKTIKKEIGEYPIYIGDTKEQSLISVLRNHLLAMPLDQIFSNNWEIKKEKKTGWINIYKIKTKNKDTYRGYYLGSHISETEKQAKKYGKELNREFVTRVKIEWEE